MKTKKEIEYLAKQDFNDRQECGHYELADLKSRDYYYDGFSNGYTQCQKDMADKIKELESEDGTPAYYYINGYMDYQLSLEMLTQCQEDMADKKYTEEDMIKFAFDTYCYISGIMKVPFNQVSENRTHAEYNFKEYINSLNKQN